MSDLPTVHRRTYRPLIQAVNAGIGLADKLGLGLTNLDPDNVLRAAQRKTGLTDFGGDEFRPALDKIAKVSASAGYTPLGKVVGRQAWIQAASNRLRYTQFVKDHPEVLDTPIERPIFVLGFPRTGTTVLQNLLCLDPGRRGLEFWELASPVPVSDDRELDQRKRTKTAADLLRLAYMVAPEMSEVHYVDANTVEECWPLFASSFSVMNWDLQSGQAEYGNWLTDEADMTAAYRQYRKMLQLLKWRRPADNLVLKNPEHLWFIDDLLTVFPDACIVWTHRDPHATIASYCSLISMQWRTMYGDFDPKRIGDHVTERFHQGIERAMQARQRWPQHHFYDIEFSRLVREPAQAVKDMARHFDLSWRPDMDESVQHWLANKRSDHRGAHKYSAERYGLSKGAIHDRYADYIESYVEAA